MALLDEKLYTKDVRRMLSTRRCPEHVKRMSRGCPEDVQKMSRGCPEDFQRISIGCQEGIQRGPKDLQRKGWGCIIMHTSA